MVVVGQPQCAASWNRPQTATSSPAESQDGGWEKIVWSEPKTRRSHTDPDEVPVASTFSAELPSCLQRCDVESPPQAAGRRRMNHNFVPQPNSLCSNIFPCKFTVMSHDVEDKTIRSEKKHLLVNPLENVQNYFQDHKVEKERENASRNVCFSFPGNHPKDLLDSLAVCLSGAVLASCRSQIVHFVSLTVLLFCV